MSPMTIMTRPKTILVWLMRGRSGASVESMSHDTLGARPAAAVSGELRRLAGEWGFSGRISRHAPSEIHGPAHPHAARPYSPCRRPAPGRPQGQESKAHGTARPRYARHLLERSDPGLFRRR